MVFDCDFEIRRLDVSLEMIEILTHDEFHGVNGRSMPARCRFKVGTEAIAVGLLEVYGCSNIEIVHESSDMQENGVSSLLV